MTKGDQVKDEERDQVPVEQTEGGGDGHEAIDVFVHSAGPECWSEPEVDSLLASWRAVLEQSPVKRYDVVRRVLKRLKGEGGGLEERLSALDTRAAKDDVWRQMELLRTEYQVFKGLQKIKGLRAVRHRCVDQLEHILDRIPASRRTHSETIRTEEEEDSPAEEGRQQRRARSVSEGQHRPNRKPKDAVDEQQQVGSGGGGGVVSLNKKQPQRRMNLTRLVRAMVSQQQTMLEQLEKLFTALEQSTAKMAALAEEAIAARQPEAGVLALLMD